MPTTNDMMNLIVNIRRIMEKVRDGKVITPDDRIVLCAFYVETTQYVAVNATQNAMDAICMN